jgi:hypothetical protein
MLYLMRAFLNDHLNARTAQSPLVPGSDLGIRSDEHGTDRISHCRSLSSMKSSEVVRILEKAHMESEDTFDLKGLSVLGRATRRPMRHEVMRKINLSN